MKNTLCNEARIIDVCRSGGDVSNLAKDCGLEAYGIAKLPLLRHIGINTMTCSRLFAKIKFEDESLFKNMDEKMMFFLQNVLNSKKSSKLEIFRGNMVDGIFALIYLLKDPTISNQFCMILKPLQLSLTSKNKKVQFWDFCITWQYSENVKNFVLQVPYQNEKKYIRQIANCLREKRYFFSLIAMQAKPTESNGKVIHTGHACTLFYDKMTGLLERFDPYESTNSAYFEPHVLDQHLQRLFSKLDGFKEFIFPPRMTAFERKGLQWVQENAEESQEGDPQGFCIPWSVLYAQARLNSPLQNPESIPRLLQYWAKSQKTSLTQVVRNYTKQLEMLQQEAYDKFVNTNLSSMTYDKQLYKTILEILHEHATVATLF